MRGVAEHVMAAKMLANLFTRSRPLALRVHLTKGLSTAASLLANINTADEAIFTSDHVEMRQSLNKLIEKEINPYVDEWEEAEIFPAHSVIKKLGDGGFLGPTRDPEYGGLGLDYSYSMAIAEELGNINCGGVPMAIGVHSGKWDL